MSCIETFFFRVERFHRWWLTSQIMAAAYFAYTSWQTQTLCSPCRYLIRSSVCVLLSSLLSGICLCPSYLSSVLGESQRWLQKAKLEVSWLHFLLSVRISSDTPMLFVEFNKHTSLGRHEQTALGSNTRGSTSLLKLSQSFTNLFCKIVSAHKPWGHSEVSGLIMCI